MLSTFSVVVHFKKSQIVVTYASIIFLLHHTVLHHQPSVHMLSWHTTVYHTLTPSSMEIMCCLTYASIASSTSTLYCTSWLTLNAYTLMAQHSVSYSNTLSYWVPENNNIFLLILTRTFEEKVIFTYEYIYEDSCLIACYYWCLCKFIHI